MLTALLTFAVDAHAIGNLPFLSPKPEDQECVEGSGKFLDDVDNRFPGRSVTPQEVEEFKSTVQKWPGVDTETKEKAIEAFEIAASDGLLDKREF